VEVIPPEDMDLWAHRDFVRDGEVQATPLNIRAGAGINYNVVGALRKGDRVTVRGEFQEWLKIAPPEETSLWVSRSLVKTAGQREKPSARPAAPAAVAPPIPAPSPAAAARPPPSAAPAAAAALVAPPPSWRLDDRQPQGRRVQREGVVKPAGFLFGRPTRYQLGGQGDRRADTYGYLYGNEEQLKSLEGRVIRLRGREYWLHNTKLPVVIVDQLAPP